MGDEGSWRQVTLSHVVTGFTAGAFSTLVSRALTYPLDTIKAQLQLGTSSNRPSPHAALRLAWLVAAEEGIWGFYRGFGAVLVGSIPGSVAYYGAFEAAKLVLPPGSGVAGGLATGAAAQLVAGAIFTPMDVIKERMQAQRQMGGLYAYKGSWQAAREAVRLGGWAALFRGYWLTNSVWLPWSMLYAAAYGEAKRRLAGQLGCPEDRLPGPAILLSSGGSAALAGLLTHPLDVVKTRLQVVTAVPGQGRVTASSVTMDLYRGGDAILFFFEGGPRDGARQLRTGS